MRPPRYLGGEGLLTPSSLLLHAHLATEPLPPGHHCPAASGAGPGCSVPRASGAGGTRELREQHRLTTGRSRCC